jgi:hypothetical protein
MIVSFELAQTSDTPELLGATRCEFDVSKFIRLSVASFPELEESQLEAFKNVSFTAHKSEERFIIISAGNQWVRTVLVPENVHPESGTNSSSSDCIIQSNILLYYPYWSQRGDGANTRVHFPSRMLREAFVEGKTLEAKLEEWVDSREDCKIGMHQRGPRCTSETEFWELQDGVADADVRFKGWIVEDLISLVIWRGGNFVQKDTNSSSGEEFEVLRRVSSHPNIVYGFGELREGTEKSAYFMEYMSNDLCSFIIERKRVVPSLPPFLSHEALDILLQFAEAMKHIHQEGVVHCDLKSVNILISEIATSENALHHLVKVADFGSARYFGDSSSESSCFVAGFGTDNYAAPEALKQRKNSRTLISYPDRIDVFSYGIVAFEVLTGENNHMLYRKSRDKFREGVIEGTLRPPLRAECGKTKEFIQSPKQKGFIQWVKSKFKQGKESMSLVDRYWHLQDEELTSLIERCWHRDPSERPTFVQICKDLNKIKVRISVWF